MNIFEFSDYKTFVRQWVAERPKNGRGEFRRMAAHLEVSTTMMSQVFNGDKQLSLEMASELADYFGLNDLETDYFFLLLHFQKAGHHRLKAKFKKRIDEARQKAQQLVVRLPRDKELSLPRDKELSETDKAVFYSSWMYSGVRNLCAVVGFRDADAIAQRLNLPRAQVQKVIEFLLQVGLCALKDGELTVGPQRTHIGSESLLTPRHHQNWRILGFSRMMHSTDDNLFYTGPMSLSRETVDRVRAELPAFIEKINKWVIPSPSETVRCLNIDWFDY
jgi:uncharacterized protein (TIGR02147 family)